MCTLKQENEPNPCDQNECDCVTNRTGYSELQRN